MSEALKRAVDLAGGQSKLARAIGVSQALVWQWLNKTGRVPAEYAIPIERAVARKVTREELRPDIYPVDEPVTPASPEQPAGEAGGGEGAGSQSETDGERVDTLKGQPKAA